MCASNSHSYTHLIIALGIVREPTLWWFITSKYPGTHDMTLACLLCGVQCTPHADCAGVQPPAHTRLRVCDENAGGGGGGDRPLEGLECRALHAARCVKVYYGYPLMVVSRTI